MDEKQERVLTFLENRYRQQVQEFKRARRFSPCTKDYVHGRLTEIREIIIALYADEGRATIQKVDNE